jgi:formylmethanofuran dehydrogenase subunit E
VRNSTAAHALTVFAGLIEVTRIEEVLSDPMQTLDELLEEAGRAHGHMCPGQILGVRMALLGCRLVRIEEPKKSKKLIVFVEIDRCATDAVGVVTGCRLGKRTMKYIDHGKVAATFLNTDTNEAVRIVAVDHTRELANEQFPHLETKKDRQMAAYKTLPDEVLFRAERVHVDLPPEDAPGRPISRVTCAACGEGVNDRREVLRDGQTLCRACAGQPYYRRLSAAGT